MECNQYIQPKLDCLLQIAHLIQIPWLINIISLCKNTSTTCNLNMHKLNETNVQKIYFDVASHYYIDIL
jgi:hypothetical protein